MIDDASGVPRGETLSCDVCIVGAGAAGITVAREMLSSRLRVLVLESGGFKREEETQNLYEGTASGITPAQLQYGRLRYFGGTTRHWAGMCRPLDRMDFEVRSWVPYSGWPLSRAALDPFYERAWAICGLDAFDDGPLAHPTQFEALEPLRRAGVVLKPVQVSNVRFGPKYRRELEASETCRVLLHANADEILPNRDVKTIERIRVRTLGGNEFHVEARLYVVACGGIENARLLLTSNGVAPAGLGNDRDLVGRFYLDHPVAHSCAVIAWLDPTAIRAMEIESVAALIGMGLDDAVLEREGLLNNVLYTLAARSPDRFKGDSPETNEQAALLSRLGSGRSLALSLCRVRSEQVPDPESRVTLSDDRDALGKRRVVVDPRLGELNRHTFLRSIRLYARAFGASGIGRLQVQPWMEELDADWRGEHGWNHQMGTTRMASSDVNGVVDADQRVFGIDNLYMAGSSVFPTGGYMNPTLTIVATSVRLAEHLKGRLDSAAAGSP